MINDKNYTAWLTMDILNVFHWPKLSPQIAILIGTNTMFSVFTQKLFVYKIDQSTHSLFFAKEIENC